jgi:Kef-type K+ transport system membrane component KefB
VGVLLNTRGLVELVILSVGLDLHILSPTLFSMMVIMALATTLMTAPLIDRILPPSSR